ncbi:MAG: amidohydrolase [Campylobacterales bacterium]|nr:amidohydrolase [Campylobacterales bacterium]
MQTVDIHMHLLSSKVSFNRFYDRAALRIFGKKMGMNYKELACNPHKAYSDSLIQNIHTSKHLSKSVLFGVDARVDEEGNELHRDQTVCASNDDVLKIYQAHPDIIIPFFSINPMRPDALDEIDKYHALGFKGAKFLQNYWGVNTKEKRYRAYFEKLKEKNIPLIIHIGSESSVHSFKHCESIEMLEQPLEVGVNVIAAHMALSYSALKPYKTFSSRPKYFSQEYFQLIDMLQVHNNLYADISALLTPVRAKVLPHLSRQYEIHEKLLFGTDYPVPFSTILNSYDLPYKKRFALAKIANPFDRYIRTILEYFPENSPIYTNYKKILDL